MIELPLILVGGLLGSAHCIGMCGPLALSLGFHSTAGTSRLVRQLVFSFGRLFTYGFCGALVGYGGAWLTSGSRGFILSQAWLAILAGVALLLMGMVTLGWIPARVSRYFAGLPCGAASCLKTFLTSDHWAGPLLAGVFTGFIPCGLVYAFLLKASSTGGVWQGWLTMVAFGLGTVPMMVVVGYGGGLLSLVNRARLFKFAAWCIVITGIISIARGSSQLQTKNLAATEPCPFCEQE